VEACKVAHVYPPAHCARLLITRERRAILLRKSKFLNVRQRKNLNRCTARGRDC
jgi:hypothetical protein